jgi:hypothetical protein
MAEDICMCSPSTPQGLYALMSHNAIGSIGKISSYRLYGFTILEQGELKLFVMEVDRRKAPHDALANPYFELVIAI